MKKRVRVIIIILIVVLILILAALAYVGYWASKNTTTLTYTNPQGEKKSIVIPPIPGVNKQEEVKADCSHKVTYTFPILKASKNASAKIREIVKPEIKKRGFTLQQEKLVNGYWKLIFIQGEQKLIIQTGAQKGIPSATFIYEWPPCSKTEIVCAKQGETIGAQGMPQVCCQGLRAMSGWPGGYQGDCTLPPPTGLQICSDCGNNICEPENGENKCNCQDCK
ncbi:hypothetical protein B6U80_00850 [Candidatus Pacearchaeota archaeon ex4484_26]|nr:MAG: hypothetical protein B6U80_00850 [Candidatus Pacearchaeota archaeon ex4484_26]